MPARLVLLALSCLLAAAAVHAGDDICTDDSDLCLVCSLLGEAPRFSVIATKSFRSAAAISAYPGYRIPTGTGDVCTARAWLAGDDLRANEPEGGIVALRSAGPAINFLPGHGYDDSNQVTGDVVTGGGSVVGAPGSLDGVVDTTGGHPAVARCRQAMSDIAAASDGIAALPPTRIFGTVTVRRGQNLEIDVSGDPRTVQVLAFDALTLEGATLRRFDGTPGRICSVNDQEPATVTVDTRFDQLVILNVGRLVMGNCSDIFAGSGYEAPIVNLPGPGPAIRIGVGVGTLGGTNLLAPHRSLIVSGTADDQGTYLNSAWVSRATLHGFAEIDSFNAGALCGF